MTFIPKTIHIYRPVATRAASVWPMSSNKRAKQKGGVKPPSEEKVMALKIFLRACPD